MSCIHERTPVAEIAVLRGLTFPRTQTPPAFIADVIEVFERYTGGIGTGQTKKGMNIDQALAVLQSDLIALGFRVETGKRTEDKIKRPVFFGENARPDLQYEIDAWHPEWRAGLEVEPGRTWMGNAVYRDLVQALVMVDIAHLLLAVPQANRYRSRGKVTVSKDYGTTRKPSPLLRHSTGTPASPCRSHYV